MSRLSSPAEWVAPLTPIISLALLPLGPIFFPRAYIVFLFVYFTGFLYQQVNHVCKFYLTSTRIQANIAKWNILNKNNTRSDKTEDDKAKIAKRSARQYEDEQEEELVYQEPNYIHTFVIPNYGEPEALLKDTIGRLAVHR
jgi:hypothetical protein